VLAIAAGSAEAFTATADDQRGGAHPLPQPGPWVSGAWQPRLSLAGSETSAHDPGYLAGGLDAGARAVTETLTSPHRVVRVGF